MYVRFKKNTAQLIQLTDITNGIPFPHQYFKFNVDKLPEDSMQWFNFLDNKIISVVEIVGEHPKLDRYRKYLNKEPDPVMEEKVKVTVIKHIQKQVEDKKQEDIKQEVEDKKQEVKQKELAKPKKSKKVISDEGDIENKVKNFLKL